jgi:hypothetical protein
MTMCSFQVIHMSFFTNARVWLLHLLEFMLYALRFVGQINEHALHTRVYAHELICVRFVCSFREHDEKQCYPREPNVPSRFRPREK